MKRTCIILLALIILVGVCKFFKQENNTNNFYKGVDISPYDNVNEEFFKQLKKNDTKFVYILFGVSQQNDKINDYTAFAKKAAELCQKNQLHYGYYFVTDVTSDTKMLEQIQFIKKFLNADSSKYHSFPLVFDYETYENDEGIDKPRIEAIMRMCQILKEDDYNPPWIYMAECAYQSLQCENVMEQCFWLANYSTNENTLVEYPKNITMLQYERGKNIMKKNIFKKYVQ